MGHEKALSPARGAAGLLSGLIARVSFGQRTRSAVPAKPNDSVRALARFVTQHARVAEPRARCAPRTPPGPFPDRSRSADRARIPRLFPDSGRDAERSRA